MPTEFGSNPESGGEVLDTSFYVKRRDQLNYQERIAFDEQWSSTVPDKAISQLELDFHVQRHERIPDTTALWRNRLGLEKEAPIGVVSLNSLVEILEEGEFDSDTAPKTATTIVRLSQNQNDFVELPLAALLRGLGIEASHATLADPDREDWLARIVDLIATLEDPRQMHMAMFNPFEEEIPDPIIETIRLRYEVHGSGESSVIPFRSEDYQVMEEWEV